MAFDIAAGKMEQLCKDAALKYCFDGTRLPVTVTISPDAELADQMTMFDGEQIDEEAEIKISFVQGQTMIDISGRICVTFNAFKKIANQAKALYSTFLQDIFEARMKEV